MKSTFLIGFLLLTHFAFAQTNYQPAILITNNGDSLRGEIDYRNWKKNPETILFINSTNERQRLDPYSIKGFAIPAENEFYVAYTIALDMRPGDQDDAIKSPLIDSPILQKRVFLLQLIRNAVFQFYQFTDDNKEHYFYVLGNELPVELIHHYTFDESEKQVRENDTYKKQLARLFADCPEAMQNLHALKFSKKAIQDRFVKYQQCNVPAYAATVLKVQDAATTHFGIIVGLMSTKYEFQGHNVELADAKYHSSLTPVFGVSLDLGIPRSRNQWHVVNELVYKNYKTNSTFTRPYNYSYTSTSSVDLNFAYVQLNSLIRYVYPSGGSLKPYLNLGIGNAFMIAENKNHLHRVYSFDREDNIKAFDNPRKYEFSVIGGIGMRLHRFEIECRYGGSKKSFSPYNSLDVNPRYLQGLLLYRF